MDCLIRDTPRDLERVAQQLVAVDLWTLYPDAKPRVAHRPAPVLQRQRVDADWTLSHLRDWMTVPELAERCGVTRETVQQQVARAFARGELERQPAIGKQKVGRRAHVYRRIVSASGART